MPVTFLFGVSDKKVKELVTKFESFEPDKVEIVNYNTFHGCESEVVVFCSEYFYGGLPFWSRARRLLVYNDSFR